VVSIRVNDGTLKTVSIPRQSHYRYRFAVQPGQDTFDIELRDGATILSAASFRQTMTGGQTTTLRSEFAGKVASGTLTADNLYPKAGVSSTIHLTFSPKDALGASIPCGLYAAPVKVAVNDGDGAVTPALVSFQKHGQTVNLSYDGALLDHPFTVALAGSPNPMLDGVTFLVDPYQIIGPAKSPISAAAAGNNGEMWFAQCDGGVSGHCGFSYFSSTGKRIDFPHTLPPIAAMTLGSNGNIWFGEDVFGTRSGGPSTVGEIDHSGNVHVFQIGPTESSANDVSAIISASGGLLWYDNGGLIGNITTDGTNAKEYPTEAIGYYRRIVEGPSRWIYYNGYTRTGESPLCGVTPHDVISCLPTPTGFASHESLTPLVRAGSDLFVLGEPNVIFTVSAKNAFKKITNKGLIPLAYTPDGTLWGSNVAGESSGSPASILRLTFSNATLSAAAYAENPQEYRTVNGLRALRDFMIGASDSHVWVANFQGRYFLRFIPTVSAHGVTR
jgi:hypothetical protein